MAETVRHLAERFLGVFSELARAYQFRDRDQVACQGLSISQCYALETIAGEGPLAMRELAARLNLDTSTITRIVDQLVSQRLAMRVSDANDRRVCRVRVSAKGRQAVSRIRDALLEEYEAILRDTPRESRQAVVDAMSRLLAAFQARQRSGGVGGGGGACAASASRSARPGRGAGARR
jgi:DNA-binding MarR family transcriptional regulator